MIYGNKFLPNEENINEGYLFSPGNLEINLEKWAPGVPLWIGGTSGDGKSTLACIYKEQKQSVVVCHTDLLLRRLRWSKEKWDERSNDINDGTYKMIKEDYISYSYINKNDSKLPFFNMKIDSLEKSNKLKPYFEDFFRWVLKECSNGFLQDKNIIIEGGDIWFMDPEYMAQQPLIILNNPRIKSLIQRAKRASNEEKNGIILEIFKQLKKYPKRKFLDDKRDDFYKAVKKEYKSHKK